MGYKTWSDNGYGVRMDDIKIRDLDSVWNLINMKQDLASYTKKCLKDNDESDKIVSADDITYYTQDFDGYYRPGISGVIAMIMEEQEDIEMSALTDYDDVEYLVLLPHYSWTNVSKREETLSKEKLENIISKYISVVSDSTPKFDYYDSQLPTP